MKRERIPYDVINVNEDVDYSRGTAKLLGCARVIVSAVMGLSIIVDVIALVMLALGQSVGIHFLVPIVMIIVDVAFLAASAFANFKFKYSNYIWIGYCIAAIVLPIASIGISSIGGEVATAVSIVINLAVHIISAAMVAAVVVAVRKKSNFKSAIVGVVAMVVIAATAIGAGVFYGQMGVWGQDSPRTVVYEEKNDEYIVKEILHGKSKSVVIADTFNGKPVVGINAECFIEYGVTDFDIKGSDKLEIYDMGKLQLLKEAINIKVDKNIINEYRDELFSNTTSYGATMGYQYFINGLSPNNLADDEVYVEFEYKLDTMPSRAVIDTLTPSLILQKNTYFDYNSIDGVLKTIIDDPNYRDLKWAYNSAGGLVINDGTVKALKASPKLDKNMTFVVNFENVYRMSIGASNDSKFSADSSWTESDEWGFYGKYFTDNQIEQIYNSIPKRERFLVGNYVNGARIENAQDLGNNVRSSPNNELTLRQEWTMESPTINSVTVDESYMYGDEISMIIDADRAGFDYKYILYEPNGVTIRSASNVEDLLVTDLALPNKTGRYILQVQATHKDSSLSSEFVYRYEAINITKKTLHVRWTPPTDNVFSGYNKIMTCELDETEFVGDDKVKLLESSFYATNAQNMSVSTSLMYEWSDRYDISATQRSTFVILPKSINVNWNVGTYEYNTFLQAPSATAKDVYNNNLPINIFGTQTNAGNDYTATADTNNRNYSITNNTVKFTIAKKKYTPQWGSNTSLTYNGSAQAPAKATGIGDIKFEAYNQLTISGQGTNVGSYTATASLPSNSNFYIDGGSVSVGYTIAAKDVTLSWNGSGLVYSGQPQAPSATAKDVFGGDLTLSVSGAKTNAGNDYTATAACADGNYNITNKTAKFNIAKAEYTPQWGSITLTYNGSAQAPAKANGIGDINNEAYNQLIISGQGINVGSYTATASLPSNSNFYIDSSKASVGYTISPKDINLSWNVGGLVYNAQSQQPNATAVDVFGGDLTITVSGGQTSAGNNYTATAACADGNYNITNKTIKFSIAKKEYTPQWGGAVLTCNGSPQAPAKANGIGDINNEAYNQLTISGQGINVGSYTATATLPTDSNFYIETGKASIDYTISPKDVSLSWNVGGLVYNAQSQKPSATAVNVFGGSLMGITISGGQTSAGNNYTATAACADGNYNITNKTAKFNIAKAEYTPQWGSITLTYNGSAQAPAKANGIGDINNEAYNQLTISGQGTNVGSYTATASLPSNSNFYIDSSKASVGYTISAKDVTLSWDNSGIYTEGESNIAPTLTSSDGVAIGAISFKYYTKGGVLLTEKPTAVGEYIIEAVVGGNYTISNPRQSYSIVAREVE